MNINLLKYIPNLLQMFLLQLIKIYIYVYFFTVLEDTCLEFDQNQHQKD